MIELMASRLANKIKNASPEKTASIEVMTFSLIAVIGTGMVIILSLVISLLIGTLKETIIVLLVFSMIRSISGGFHFSKAEYCTIVSVFVCVIIPLISITDELHYIFMITSLIIFSLLAPIGINQSRIFTVRHYPFLKIASLVLISCNFLINSHLLTIIYLVQGLTLVVSKLKGGEMSES